MGKKFYVQNIGDALKVTNMATREI